MRFGLKALLLGISVLAVALFLLTTDSGRVAVPGLVLISVSLAALFTAGLVYGTANVCAFCLGAMFPAGGTFLALTWMLCVLFMSMNNIKGFNPLFTALDEFAFTLRVWSASSWILEVVAGSLTVGLRMALRPKSNE
jgi:hypothetical protein